MKIAISAESTVDLTPELIEKYHIHIIPFQVTLGDKTAADGTITPPEIFEYVEKYNVLPRTSAVNEFAFTEHFTKLKKEYDAIIHISIGHLISSAVDNAKKVAAKMENVYVIDSESLSTGIALLVIYASSLADQGVDVKEIVSKVEARVSAVQASFVVNTIEYLYKGGRCTSFERFGANLFRLKPQIVVRGGKLIPGKKFIGRNSAVIRDYCKAILEEFNHPDLSVAFVTHSHASPEMIEEAKEALKKRGFQTVYETVAGATITSHCGPKTLGILYINDGQIAIPEKKTRHAKEKPVKEAKVKKVKPVKEKKAK